MSTATLVAELAVLRAAVKAPHDLIVEAQDRRTQAMEDAGVPKKWGGAMYDLPASEEWRYPSVQAATAAVEALEEAPGYFWACSRMRDIEILLGQVAGDQLPLRTENGYVPLLRGHMPEPHPSVRTFLAA